VRCGSIEHKMGIHGSATCVMNFDGAQGWLIGQPQQGPACDVHHDEHRAPRVGMQGLG
jgi:alkylation response protein AidB-like acyl-CoA dehydrogenase